ncbi:ras GTPase-activating protein-binding protein 1 [Selaginella moellendorffii]|uniref:ras GTPase-activating protein-binding protein 1 n=1 Tax=Selaginella moellendorffii TaxID=88036 RepID=UPI000D1D0435|nr:ras GTPase-activating protein-binding protein 1 [Selaginella moellendorffii]XP_024528250.1 ras GTPase-activating protein-binding protein 1 [Selaginella moellendorffii]|eukprot:XP_002967633.2 ras GTPase-activating protein-binding protein 1 [Selaginella moellendorffii]
MAVAHAQMVGNSFINQYYNVLHQSPQVVHRFYTNASCLTRAEAGPEGQADTVFSQSGIHEKVMSLDYVGLRAEIKTVDCQDSYSGSVLVMVTGSLSNRSNGRRDFVQTFFLAPQEKGYFVLNDIFRYLDEPQVSTMSYVVANGPQEHSPTPESVPDTTHLEVSEATPVATEEQIDEGYDIPDADEEVLVEETVQNTVPLDADEVLDIEDSQSQADEPKKSYASILRVVKAGGGDSVQHVLQHSPKPPPSIPAEKPALPVPQTVVQESPVVSPPIETTDETAAAPDTQGDGKSIYIKNLPMSVTTAQLEEEFHKFGTVKPGTNIKKQNNVCYAFLEFEDASSARSAIQASGSFQISGKPVMIEEKRPLSARGYRTGGRGRGNRNDGSRGRGYYNRGAAGPAPPTAAPGGGGGGGGSGSGGNRNYEQGNRGRGSRGGYNSANNNPGDGGRDGGRSNSEEYHPRYESQGHNYNNNYTNTNATNAATNSGNSSAGHHHHQANSSNTGSSNNHGYPNSRPPRRYVSRGNNNNSNSSNNSNNPNYNRSSSSSTGGAPAAPPAAVTA